MSERTKELSRRIVELTPAERIELVDTVLASLDQPDDRLDELWRKEAEDRLTAYRKGEITSLSVSDVSDKYRTP